jgi:putative MATE family efflux protein
VIVRRHVRHTHASVRPVGHELRLAGVTGAQLTVRTASLLLTFTVASAVAARLGDVRIAAHQIAFQVWFFLALTLDAIAIAGQAIVGRSLGASDEAGTRAATRRMLRMGLLVGCVLGALVLVCEPLIALGFTQDPAVRRQLMTVLVVVALMQPLAAVVFVLDGVLIGAGDVRYLAVAMIGATLCFLPLAVAVLVTDAGLVALWGALCVFMGARFYGMMHRYRGHAWLVTGAVRR